MTLTAEEGEITSICSEYVTQHSPYYYQVQDHRQSWLKNSSVFFSESVRTVTIPLATVLLIHCLLCPISKKPNFQGPAEFNSNSGSFLEFLEYRMNHIWKKTGHDQFWFLSSQIFSLKKNKCSSPEQNGFRNCGLWNNNGWFNQLSSEYINSDVNIQNKTYSFAG